MKIKSWFKDTDKPHIKSWDEFGGESFLSHWRIHSSRHTMQQSGYNYTQCQHQQATQFIQKMAFSPHLTSVYGGTSTEPKQYTILQIDSITFVLPTWLSTHSWPNWKDTLRKMKFCIGKEKGKWLGKESHWVVLISKIDGFRFLFVFTDKRQHAVAGSACSSEKWSKVSRLPISKKCFPERQLSFLGLTASVPIGLQSSFGNTIRIYTHLNKHINVLVSRMARPSE